MKVLLVIDHLGPGGAQRQIVELACGLKQRGHDVEAFIYFPQHDFFRRRIDENGIPIHEYSKTGRFSPGLVARLGSVLRIGGFDVALSYLKSTNVYAELAKLIGGFQILVVSERTSRHDDNSFIAAMARRLLHVFADRVVANSTTHSEWLRRNWWLREKVECIYNGVNLDTFGRVSLISRRPQEIRLLGIGRIGPEKNILNFIKALKLFHDEFGYVPRVTWAGRRDQRSAGQYYCAEIDALLDTLPEIRDRLDWLDVQSDIPALLQEHHAVILPSHYEGLPNVVCEGLAAGRPALVSNVCDHPLLITDGERGFLFEPDEPKSIAVAIKKLVGLDDDGWRDMSRNARDFAVANLGAEKMVTAYESLFTSLIGGPASGGAQSEQL